MITDYLRTLRLFNRNVRLYLIVSFVLGLTVWGGIYSVLLNLYLLRLGYDPEFVGLINASGYLGFAVFCLPAGALGGRWGNRRTMIAGLSLALVGFGTFPLAELIPRALQDGWLLATYLLGGAGVALYLVSSDPLLMGSTGPEERDHVFSARAALIPVAGFAGSLVGGLLPGLFAATLDLSLDHPAPYRYLLFIAALLFIPGILAALATREVSARNTHGIVADRTTAPFGLIALLSVVVLLTVTGEAAASTFFNVYLDAGLHVSVAQIGTLVALGRLLSVPAALTMPLLVSRWGKSRIYVWASLGVAVSLLPLALIPYWGAAGLGYVSLIVLVSIIRPAITVYQQEIVSARWRAPMSGATGMAAGLGSSAMSFVGGYVITALGYPSLFLIGAGLTVAGALIFWAHFRTPRGELAHGSATDGPV